MARGSRSGIARNKHIAEKGTGTWGVLQLMNMELRDNPGDVKAASEVVARKARNLGLCSGPIWDEHGPEICVMLYTRYVQPFEEKPTKVPDDKRGQTQIPPGIRKALGEEPEFQGDEEEPEFTPPPFSEQEPEILIGASARKYFLAGDKVSQQLEIGLWSHEDILAKIGVFEHIISGNTRSLEAWTRLLEMVPPGGLVKDYVTNEQLRELNL